MGIYTIKNLAKALSEETVSECQMCGADSEIYVATHKETGLHHIKIFCRDCGSACDFLDVVKSIEEEEDGGVDEQRNKSWNF